MGETYRGFNGKNYQKLASTDLLAGFRMKHQQWEGDGCVSRLGVDQIHQFYCFTR